MMKSAKSLAWMTLLFLFSAPAFAFTYTNQELGFSATLPDDLPDLSIQTRVKSLVSRGNLTDKSHPVEVVIIQDLDGPIGREDYSKRKNKPQNLTLEKTTWKGFQIDLFRVIENTNAVTFVTLNAQVPLKPHAIQLTVGGPETDENKLRADMQKILATVDGSTNWLTEEQRNRPVTNRVAIGVGLIILIFGRLRISKHYGLKGTGARVAGFFILLLGFALPFLARWGVDYLRSVGVPIGAIHPLEGLLIWIGVHLVIIWGMIVMLVKEYGNAYEKKVTEVTIMPEGSDAPPKPVKKVITECHMCKAPIPLELQETARTCPNCGADLSRAR